MTCRELKAFGRKRQIQALRIFGKDPTPGCLLWDILSKKNLLVRSGESVLWSSRDDYRTSDPSAIISSYLRIIQLTVFLAYSCSILLNLLDQIMPVTVSLLAHLCIHFGLLNLSLPN